MNRPERVVGLSNTNSIEDKKDKNRPLETCAALLAVAALSLGTYTLGTQSSSNNDQTSDTVPVTSPSPIFVREIDMIPVVGDGRRSDDEKVIGEYNDAVRTAIEVARDAVLTNIVKKDASSCVAKQNKLKEELINADNVASSITNIDTDKLRLAIKKTSEYLNNMCGRGDSDKKILEAYGVSPDEDLLTIKSELDDFLHKSHPLPEGNKHAGDVVGPRADCVLEDNNNIYNNNYKNCIGSDIGKAYLESLNDSWHILNPKYDKDVILLNKDYLDQLVYRLGRVIEEYDKNPEPAFAEAYNLANKVQAAVIVTRVNHLPENDSNK